MLLYAWLLSIFSLQYLRSSLTIPIHFKRRERLDSGFINLVPGLDRQISSRTRVIIAMQVTLGLVCIVFNCAVMYPKIYTLIYNYVESVDDSVDFKTDLIISSSLTAFIYFGSFIFMLIAL